MNTFIETIKFFNTNAGGIQAIFALLIFLITTIYVIVSIKMLKEMKIQRVKSEMPEISIRLDRIKSSLYDLVIENISNVEVFDLEFIEYPNLKISNYHSTKEIGFLKSGIKYMGVGQLYRTLFLNYLYEENRTKTIKFFVEYKDKNGIKFGKAINLDLSLFSDTGPLKSDTKKLVAELKKINENLKEIIKKKNP